MAKRKILIDNAGQVLCKGWSPRLIALSAVTEGLMEFTPLLAVLPPWTPIALLGITFASRFVAQGGLSR